MEQVFEAYRTYLPKLAQVSDIGLKYVPGKMTMIYTLFYLFFGSDYGFLAALIMLLGCVAASVGVALDFLFEHVEQIQYQNLQADISVAESRSNAICRRAAAKAGVFFSFSYVLQQPFSAFGVYNFYLAFLLFYTSLGFALFYSYADHYNGLPDARKTE